MFENIGKKIKGVAEVVTWLGIGLSFILGFSVMLSDDGAFFLGLLIIIGGSLAAWLSSLTLYGFGQLIENSDVLVEQGKKQSSNQSNVSKEETPQQINFEYKNITKTDAGKNSSVPYWCEDCGQEGPYKGACPHCGSWSKRYNA